MTDILRFRKCGFCAKPLRGYAHWWWYGPIDINTHSTAEFCSTACREAYQVRDTLRPNRDRWCAHPSCSKEAILGELYCFWGHTNRGER